MWQLHQNLRKKVSAKTHVTTKSNKACLKEQKKLQLYKREKTIEGLTGARLKPDWVNIGIKETNTW
jgi:hypothetical protein